jgi:hypothetical protein
MQILKVISAKVLPTQDLLPLENGRNEKGCLFFPEGVK